MNDTQTPQTVALATVTNPWRPNDESRQVRAVAWRPGMTVADCARESGIMSFADGEAYRLRCGMNGKTIEGKDMDKREVKPGDSVVFGLAPANSGGGGGGKNTMRIVAMIAVVVVAAVFTYGAAGAFGSTFAGYGASFGAATGIGTQWGSMVMMSALAIGGSYLVNSLMPAAKTDLSKMGMGNWGEASQTYGWDLSRNINREGLALAVIYGTMMVTPPILESHVMADANGDQYLNMLLGVGEGQLAIDHDQQYDNKIAVYLNGKHFSEYTRTFAPQPGTINIASTGIASASSTKASTKEGGKSRGYYPSYAIDGASTGYSDIAWCSGAESAPWWMIDFGSGKTKRITKYSVYVGASNYWGLPTVGWTLVGLNSVGGTETTLHTIPTVDLQLGKWNDFTFTNSTSYRFYKLKFTGSTALLEIQFFEDVNASSVVQALELSYNAGTNDQPAFSNFQRTYSTVTGFNPVKLTSEFQSGETEGNAATILGIFLSFPGGLYKIDDSGNVITESVTIAIEHRRETSPGVWGSWTAWPIYTASAAVNAAYSQYVEKSELTAGKYQVRTKFNSPPSLSTRNMNTCYWSALQTGITDAFTYPNTAVLGLRAMATDQFNGGLPRIQCKVTRDTVPVRTSAAGVTPEVWADKPSSNPAWACYDMLTNSRYGAGIDPDKIMIDEFTDWAAYCDNMITYSPWQANHSYTAGQRIRCTGTSGDGYSYECTQSGTTGGTEPTWVATSGSETTSGTAKFTARLNRLDCNIAFDTATGLVSALGDLSQCGRAIVVQKGGKYGAIIDRAGIPVQLFTMGNIMRGSFKIDYLDLKDRANIIEITYFDRDRDYERTVIEVRTDGWDSTTTPERNASPVVLYGCTSREQAIRHGRHLLLQTANITRAISFEVGVDAIACTVGDVINFSHDVPQWGYSGRLVNYASISNAVTLDRTVSMTYGTNYELQVRDQITDELQSVSVQNPAAPGQTVSVSTFTLASPIGSGWQDAVYAFGITGQSVKPYRVLAITRGQDQNRKITACEYVDSIYSDTTAANPEKSYSDLQGVFALQAGETVRNGVHYALVTWQGGAIKYAVEIDRWSGAMGEMHSRIETTDTWHEFEATKNTRYQIRVISFDPKSEQSVFLDVMGDKNWNMNIACTRSYSDKSDTSQFATIGWDSIPYMDESKNVEYSPVQSKDGSSGYGEFYSIKWPWKTATLTRTIANDGAGIIDNIYDLNGIDFTNTDSGVIYVTVTDRGSGAYSIELFKDSGRTQQIAHTANYTIIAGAKTLIADNASGICGSLSVTTLAADTDITITCTLTPNFTSGAQYAKKWGTDIRNSKNMFPWIICVSPATNATACTISWDPNSVPLSATDGLFIVEVDPLGFAPLASSTARDMRVYGYITVTPGATARYWRVYFGVTPVTQTISLANGWNYFTPSVYPETPAFSLALKTEALANAGSFSIWDAANNAYQQNNSNNVVEVAPMQGLILSSTGAQNITITGIPVPSQATMTMHNNGSNGWNLVGFPVDVTPPPVDPRFNGLWYGWNGSSFVPQTTALDAGKAYWRFAKETFDIIANP